MSAAPSSNPASPGLAWIDRLRALAATYVVLHHAMQNIPHGLSPDGLSTCLKALFNHGHVAVDVFIVLSGFCLTLPMRSRSSFGSYRTFLARRTVRLVLPYYAACLFSLVLIAGWLGEPTDTHWSVSLPVTRAGVVTHLLLIHQWWASTAVQINHPLWSVGVEYQIYMLFPAIFWACRTWGALGSTALLTLAAFLMWHLSTRLGYPNPSEWGVSINYVGLFSMGVAAAWLAQRPVSLAWERFAAALVVGLMMFWLTKQLVRDHRVTDQVTGFFVGLLAAWYLYRKLRAPNGVAATGQSTPGLVGRIGTYWGERSFSLYLVHAPVLQMSWLFVVRPLQLPQTGWVMAASMAFGLAASLLVTWCFHAAIERPCHRWSRQIGREEHGPARVLHDNVVIAPMGLARIDPP